MKRFLVMVWIFLLSGCCHFAYWNEKIPSPEDSHASKMPFSPEDSHASFLIKDDRGNKDVLLLLALSGGGSRAAYFSASAMLKLQNVFPDIDILQEVDVISSISGGSLPAAYYCISQDPEGPKVKSNRKWEAKEVKDLMSRNYLRKWIINWFWPHNIVRYWLSAYDRSDIMAQTFEDNLFDVHPTGVPLTFQDLNTERPYLILNATRGTEDADRHDFGQLFTFTREDFKECLNSNIDSYPIARAVMASAAFPGAFNYMTLNDYRVPKGKKAEYLHVFDGGINDSLGLKSCKKVILQNQKRYQHFIVILIDAHKKYRGLDRHDCDPRSRVSYAIDMNFRDAFVLFLDANRKQLLGEFQRGEFDDGVKIVKIEKWKFCHVTFDDIPDHISDIEGRHEEEKLNLRDALNTIPTNFRICPDDAKRIDKAVDILITKENCTLNQIKDILQGRPAGGHR